MFGAMAKSLLLFLKVRSPAFTFSMLHTCPPCVRAETWCSPASPFPQRELWLHASSNHFSSQNKKAGIALSLHVSSKSGPICISLPCDESKLSKAFLSFLKKCASIPSILQLFNQSDGLVFLVVYCICLVFSELGHQQLSLQTGGAAVLTRCWLMLPIEASQG